MKNLTVAAAVALAVAHLVAATDIEREVLSAERDCERLQAKLKDRCSLTDYAARTVSVNGTNLWARALQAALREHEIVRIPPRREPYFLEGAVDLPSNRRIEAAGATVALVPGVTTVMLRTAAAQDGTLRPIAPGGRGDNIAIVGGRWVDNCTERLGFGKTGLFNLQTRKLGNFYGVSAFFYLGNANHVTVKDVTFVRCGAFAVQAGDGDGLVFSRIRFDDCFADGLHLNGNVSRVHAKDVRGKVGDDLVALNAYDWLHCSVNFGPQRYVLCEDLELIPKDGKGYPAIRILPAKFRYADGSKVDCAVSDVVFRRVRGIRTFKAYLQTAQYDIGTEPEWSEVGSGGNLIFEDIDIDLTAPIDLLGGYATSDPLRGHYGAFEFGANLTSVTIRNVRIRFHLDDYPLGHLATVGPKSACYPARDGRPAREIFNPYVSSRVGKLTVEGLTVEGRAPEQLIYPVTFSDINGDGRSTGRGTVDEVDFLAGRGSRPWRALVVDDGGAYFRETVMTPAKTPVSFTYDGRERIGFGGCEVLARSLETKGVETKGRLRVRIDETLVAEIEGAYRADFGETEYVLWFENDGAKPSKALSDVVCCRYEFDRCSDEEMCPRLRGIRGDIRGFYSPYEVDCWNKPKGFSIEGKSRPTHVEFPYFNMYRKDGGLLCAIGWAGTWRADFDNLRDRPQAEWRYRISLRGCPGFASALLPGERIRTARAVLIPHRGSDPDHVSNLWRAWFRTYNEPKANAAGDALRPLTTAYFALDTGRPNSDGSVSEGADTWRPTLEKLVAERVVPDFRWFDAGWYFDPRGRTIESNWGDVGSWALDTLKWPDGSFRTSVDAGHAVGMKTLVWFEPERVCDPAALATNYGYRTEWALPLSGGQLKNSAADVCWNNIGDPACWTWTRDRIFAMLDAGDVDLYREDNNASPGPAWEEGDRRAEAALKLPRKGMTETKGVMGHWALWDAIVARGRARGRCTFVDSCASGGGRNDLESLRRGVPFTRSDADRAKTVLRLSMNASLCRWIPFHGSGSPSWEGGLGPEGTFGQDPYDFRAALLPIYNACAEFSHNPKVDYVRLRRNLAEWRSVSDLLVKDFYVITSWHPELDAGTWDVFAYDDAEKGESVILAFRQAESPFPSCEARLKFADPSAEYEITDADTGKSVRASGRDLRERGYNIVLPERKSSALLRMKRIAPAASVAADLLAPVFGDRMVLQRDRPVPVWGRAAPGAKVEVSFAGQAVGAVADAEGRWRATLGPMPASKEGRTLSVVSTSTSTSSLALHDVLVGEVWLASGQSNMELPIWGPNPHRRDREGAMVAQTLTNGLVRFARTANYKMSDVPRETPGTPVVWKTLTRENLLGDTSELGLSSFSAIGTYFALELFRALDVPVGVIGAYWGGTRIEPWIPAEGFASVPSLAEIAARRPSDAKQRASVLWNEQVAPWVPFAVRGAIWYQGCSNVDEPERYCELMHALYNGWSRAFGRPDFRLYFVQLAPYDHDGAAAKMLQLQEQQAKFAAEEKNAAMVVTTDVGNPDDCHPNEKRLVAMRLALHALKRDYGRDIVADSPALSTSRVEGGRFILGFDHVREWSQYRPDFSVESGFEVAGADGVWHPAKVENLEVGEEKRYRSTGRVKGADLIVSSPDVPDPRALRYLYVHPWKGTFFNEVGLPLGPFHIEVNP